MAASEWTVETLRELFLTLNAERDKAVSAALAAQEKAVAAALSAADRAVNKAEIAAEKRLDSVNEFRGQLADQAKTFMPRAEYEVQHRALEERLSQAVSTLSEKIEANNITASRDLTSLNITRAGGAGRSAALSQGWAMFVGGGGILVGAVALVVSLVRG